MQFQELNLRKDPDCVVCGEHPTVRELVDYDEFCGIHSQPTNGAEMQNDQMTVKELKSRLDNKEDIFILDVREPNEYQICNLGGHLIPLKELPGRVEELDASKEIVVHCKMGGRSSRAVEFLKQ